jgi:hypothetical protein
MATNFLEAPGTNGFISAPINLLSSEINTLGGGAAAVSSVGGTSGVFNQTSFGNANWLSLYFTAGGAFTPVVGQCLYGWFLLSPDGGSNFETQVATPSTTVLALSRNADFIISFDNAAYATSNIRWCQGRFIKAPWESCKVLLQNIGGSSPVALPASGNLIKAGGVAIQY